MREPTYLVLASLADGPLHGYAIIRDVQQLSEGRVRLTTGALYTVLDRLGAEGYVRPVRQLPAAGRIRNCYWLTRSGLACLYAEVSRKAVGGLIAQAGGGDRLGRIVSVGGRVRLGGNARTA